MKTAMVTGGAGFIGSHVNDALLRRGYFVVAVDNLSLGRLENIRHLEGESRFAFHKMDILSAEPFAQLLRDTAPDVVFHLAANSDIAQSHANPRVDLSNTFMTTFNVLEAMRQAGCRNLVFSSTSAIYGETRGLITENYAPLFPVSHYGAGKLASEAFVSSFAANYGFTSWIVRFPNVVGERATHGVIFDFIARLRKNPGELRVLGNGRQKKPYLYVKDLVEAILFVWDNTSDPVNYFNVGAESRTLVSEIAEMVVEEMGLAGKTKIVYGEGDRGWVGDVPEFEYDLAKLRALGWRAGKTSNEAVRTAIRHIVEHDTP